MKDYKIEITQRETYVFDARAENQEEAEIKAMEAFEEAEANGTLHYNSTTGHGSTTIGKVYDVTGTDDAPIITN